MTGHTFKGRAVEIGVVSFGDLVAAQEAAEASGKPVEAMWRMLVKAATYLDDGSPVFSCVGDIMSAPATEAAAIMAMSAETSRLNVPREPTVPSP